MFGHKIWKTGSVMMGLKPSTSGAHSSRYCYDGSRKKALLILSKQGLGWGFTDISRKFVGK